MSIQSTTRREALQLGSRAALAAAIPTLAAGSEAATAGNADAGLIALGRELEAAEAHANEVGKVHSLAEERWFAARPPKPLQEEMPAELVRLRGRMTLDDFGSESHPISVWFKESTERAAERRAAYDMECDRVSRAVGLDATSAAFGEAMSATSDIGGRIFATPAVTLAGVLVKMRAAKVLDLWSDRALADDGILDGWAGSIIDDVTAMAERAAAA